MSELPKLQGIMERNKPNVLGWVQVALTVVLCAITVGLVPWVRAVNSELSEHTGRLLKMESWAAEGPRITPDKLRTWKLEIEDEMRKEFGAKLDSISLGVQRLEISLAKHEAATIKQP